MNFNITPFNSELKSKTQHLIDHKTKPLGALGQLEELALQIALIQNTSSPTLSKPHLVVFASDHGIAQAGVSAYPQEVTFQMVMNFVQGGAAINVFCTQNNIALKVVDAGVNYAFPADLAIVHQKIANGTKPFHRAKAMSREEAEKAIETGANIVKEIHQSGCNVIGFGEMGIGNTSSASMLMHYFTNTPLAACIGKGTGLNEEQLQHKQAILQQAKDFHQLPNDATPLEILATFGGFEIAMMCGAMLQAASLKMLVLIDGFIATSAFLVAQAIEPLVIEYAVCCHQSDEAGHAIMLKYLHKKPILQLNLRLGEGTGVALAYPILQNAIAFLNDMASFESAGVSNS